MNQTLPKPRFTLAEYLAIEPEGNVRHEFIDGELVAMTGTSKAHNFITSNLTIDIGSHCRGTPCRVASHDLKVVIANANRGFYPDLVVTCNSDNSTDDDYTETRPILIIEVLSPSTEAFDRGDKRRAYQQLSSLQNYVLVAQDRHWVEVHHRQQGNAWVSTEYGANDTVELASIDLQLPVALIYEGIVLNQTAATK